MAFQAVSSQYNVSHLYHENILAKIIQVAQRPADDTGTKARAQFPDIVPQSGLNVGRYVYKEEFWTCGFFPGSIYLVLERLIKFPHYCNIPHGYQETVLKYVRNLSRMWSGGIEWMSERTDIHDLGFILQPSFQKDWELFGSDRSFRVLQKGAHSLASRYNSELGSIRSWNYVDANKRHSYASQEDNFLVIIDSVCNLDLLFYVGYHSKNESLMEIATSHAHVLRLNNVRQDFSTFHVVNFDPKSGDVKAKFTAQGYADNSTWTRGQAWSILGFAKVYAWTKDPVFLDTAIGCAELFLRRIAENQGKYHHPNVPPWDFDAPDSITGEPLRDSCAATIAAVGLLHLHRILISEGSLAAGYTAKAAESSNGSRFLEAALKIVEETLDLCLDRDFASFGKPHSGTDWMDIPIEESSFDAILRHATANNSPDAFQRTADHGSVYADYFLLEFGNLLRSTQAQDSTDTGQQ